MFSTHLNIALHNFICKFWMVNENFLLSHLFNSVVMIALYGVVVLINLNTKSATGCEVIWLWQMSQTMVLHSLKLKLSQRTVTLKCGNRSHL